MLQGMFPERPAEGKAKAVSHRNFGARKAKGRELRVKKRESKLGLVRCWFSVFPASPSPEHTVFHLCSKDRS